MPATVKSPNPTPAPAHAQIPLPAASIPGIPPAQSLTPRRNRRDCWLCAELLQSALALRQATPLVGGVFHAHQTSCSLLPRVACRGGLPRPIHAANRSEERRVGKECRSRWS